MLCFVQVYKQSTTLKNEVSRLKTHKKQLSSELGELKGKYQSLSQEKSTFINESETIMCQLEEMLIETKSSFTKLPFLTKHKVCMTLLLYCNCHDLLYFHTQRGYARL